jgi:hypothetical protein
VLAERAGRRPGARRAESAGQQQLSLCGLEVGGAAVGRSQQGPRVLPGSNAALRSSSALQRNQSPSPPPAMCMSPSLGGCASPGAGAAPTGMERAKVWSEEVEEVYRLQEAGYRDEAELLACAQPPPERWPNGCIKKLRARTSLGGNPSFMYFKQGRECTDGELNRVKMYRYT